MHLHPAVFRILMNDAAQLGIERLRLTRDPFRLLLQYNFIAGQFNGIGFLRDRDNVIIQLEIDI
jgi:hypothetical protein